MSTTDTTVLDAASREFADPRCLTDEEATALLANAPWRRMVAIGDSIVEGLGAQDGDYRPRSWVDRVADALAAVRPEFTARNLGLRDLVAARIHEQQLEPALALAPDLVLLSAGGNDLMRPVFDIDRVESELDAMIGALRASGADVVTLGLFDAAGSPYIPDQFRAPWAERIRLLSDRTAAVGERHGAIHVDCTSDPACGDADIYSPDGLHCSNHGHAIAAALTIRQLAAHAGP